MNVLLQDLTIGIDSGLITSKSLNYRPPSWPPPREWPVVIDKDGLVVSRWGDPIWNISPWAGKRMTLNFADGKAENLGQAKALDAKNADLLRMVATWFIWGRNAVSAANSVKTKLNLIRPIVMLCSRNGISADNLWRFPKVLERVLEVIQPSNYDATIAILHRLYDAKEILGFTIVNPDGLGRLAKARPNHERMQTPYIPPRIWMYQITRLRECLMDFLAHREQIEACFRFCLDAYTKNYGSLEAALAPGRDYLRGPFASESKRYPTCTYQGTFAETAARFGIAKLMTKWCDSNKEQLQIQTLSNYFSLVTHAGMMYIANFTLQRKEEIGSLRASCMRWEDDEELGRVPIICGETTKTDPDSDARWVASPSVEAAIEAASAVARLRMLCDSANPLIGPTAADQKDPYLYGVRSEPWGAGVGRLRPYHIRGEVESVAIMSKLGCKKLFDSEHLRITREDLEVARQITPSLPESEFAVGKVWPLGWHQFRRTGAVNMFADGSVSDSTMQQQLKHSTRLMSLYYGRGHSHLQLNKDVESAVIVAMYQAQAEMIKRAASGDRFMSPNAPDRKEALVINVLNAKDANELTEMAKKGKVAFREHRLGACMKAGVCEYGGIESVARCAGGDGGKPCTDVLYDPMKEPQVRADLRRVTEEIKMLPTGQPRYNALVEERRAMENYLNVISTR
jgi:hypothetical protein